MPSQRELADLEEVGRVVRDRVSRWLDCRLGEEVHVSAGNAWVLEVRGELRQRGAVPGLYVVGDSLLDLNGIEQAAWLHETDLYPGGEQLVVGLESGIALTVTTGGGATIGTCSGSHPAV